ncbi:hypothetical protein [Kitasatospora sp. NPDC088351]|uniref:hypothetical protein n=1 Tax=Kitasatospora sp. NPDC088351 TaxID=3155180 RepID=UPI00341E506D
MELASRDRAPLPTREVISPDGAWIYQPLNVHDPDSPILGIRQAVFGALCRDSDEMGALTVIALSQYGPECRALNNPMVVWAAQMFLRLSEDERETTITRLLARGYVNVAGPRAVQTNREVARVFDVAEMDPILMSEWAAAKRAAPVPRI